jgi:hypothetical protein
MGGFIEAFGVDREVEPPRQRWMSGALLLR